MCKKASVKLKCRRWFCFSVKVFSKCVHKTDDMPLFQFISIKANVRNVRNTFFYNFLIFEQRYNTNIL